MRPAIGIAALVAAVVGCGDGGRDGVDASAPTDATSPVDATPFERACEGPAQPGSRLRVIGLEGGGERWSTGWFDTEHDHECAIRSAADGVRRCLPALAGQPVFLDAACTQPAARLGSDVFYIPVAGDLISMPATGDCAPRFEVRVIGAGVDGEGFALDGAGRCRSTNIFTTYFPLGDALAASAFVGFSSTAVGDGDVQQIVETGSDGSRWCSGLVDRAGAACSPVVAADGALRCLPSGAEAMPIQFVDPACTRLAGRRRDTCETALAVYDGELGMRRVFPVVAPASAVYEVIAATGACVPAASAPWYGFVELGAELTASTFPSLSLELAAGTSRLRPHVVVDGAGVRARHGAPWDTQRNEACRFGRAADGLRRCLPAETGYAEPRFRDDGCTQPVDLVLGLLGPGTPRYGSKSGVPDARIFTLRAPITGPFFQGRPGNCQPWIAAWTSAWPLGDEVPPAEFAFATLYR